MQAHFVTRAYLARFTDPATPAGQKPYVWVYERDRATPFARAPKKLAVKTDYYSATVNGKREDVVEESLSVIEGKALPVIQALHDGKDPAALTDEERYALALFLGFLKTRVPKFREYVERVTADIMKQIGQLSAAHPEHFERTLREAMKAKGQEPPKDIEAVRQFVLKGEYMVHADPLLSMQMMIEQAGPIAEYIFNFEWRILEAPAGAVFVTSDAPLELVATERLPAPWGWGTGWFTPWMEATFPLGPGACLLISQHRPTGRELIDAARVHEANWRTAAYAHEQVFSSVQLALAQLQRPAGSTWWTPLTDAIVPRFAEMDDPEGGKPA